MVSGLELEEAFKVLFRLARRYAETPREWICHQGETYRKECREGSTDYPKRHVQCGWGRIIMDGEA